MKTKLSGILYFLTIVLLILCLCGCPNANGPETPTEDTDEESVVYTVSVADLSAKLIELKAQNIKTVTLKITDAAADFAVIGEAISENLWFDWDVTLDLSACTSVLSVNENAFQYAYGVTSIILPEGLQEIEQYAFGSKVKTISLPSTVSSISLKAFNMCSSLKTITVATGNVDYCSSEGVLYTANKTTMFVPEGYEGTLTIPDEVTQFAGEYESEAYLFNHMNIPVENIQVGEGNALYASVDGILYNKQKTKLLCVPSKKVNVTTIPSTVTELIDECCWNCKKLEEIVIPEGVQTIGDAAFVSCDKIDTFVVPSTVTKIGYMFLYNCKKCSTLIFKGMTLPTMGTTYPPLMKVTDFSIKVPETSVYEYQTWALTNKNYFINGLGKSKSGAAEEAEQWQAVHDAIVAGNF